LDIGYDFGFSIVIIQKFPIDKNTLWNATLAWIGSARRAKIMLRVGGGWVFWRGLRGESEAAIQFVGGSFWGHTGGGGLLGVVFVDSGWD
jgi:hypothetical protein